MKRTILILLTLFISNCLTFSQNAIVTYTVENINERDSDRVKKLKEELSLMEFTLKYDTSYSSFIKEKNIPKDKYIASVASIIAGAPSNFFQDINERLSYFTTEIASKTYNVDHSYKMKDWKLTTETATIENYTCYKAILKEYNNRHETYFETIAWYTPEIPIGYGPIGYGGLPGLILQLQFKKSIFTAKRIILNPKNFSNETKESTEKISVEEYVRLMRSSRKVTPD